MLPGRDGLWLAGALGQRATEAAACEVVLISGRVNLQTAEQALRSRVFHFIRKPAHLFMLTDVLARAHAAAMRRRAAGPEAEAEARAQQPAGPAAPDATATAAPVNLMELAGRGLSLQDRQHIGAGLGCGAEELDEILAALRPSDPAPFAPVAAALPTAMVTANDIVAALELRHRDAALRQGVRLVAHGDEAVSFATHRATLLLALDQLVRTALQASAAGQSIAIDTMPMPGAIWFGVTHQGQGLSDAQEATLRHALRQSDLAQLRQVPVIGEPVSLCQGLTALLSGRLLYAQDGQRGTTLSIHLPAPSIG